MKRKGFEMSFTWLFALIVGAVILFLAIYGVSKFIRSEQTLQDAKTGKDIGVLLNPLETGFESFKATTMTFPVETRVYNKCSLNGFFGRQILQVSQKNFGEWTKTDIDVGFSNKYIYSEVPLEGKEMTLFSKPFEFPFKVADLIYMFPSDEYYCFASVPEEIAEEIESLSQKNLKSENCSSLENPVKVCFSSLSDCDVIVNYDGGRGSVRKEGEVMHFEGDALMYAAIFSQEQEYECQLKRLMKRTTSLCDLYKNKAIFIETVGCHSGLGGDLMSFKNMATNLESSSDLMSLSLFSEDIHQKNSNNWNCKLW